MQRITIWSKGQICSYWQC